MSEVSSERVSEERLRAIIEWAERYGEDARESCNVHEVRGIATELLALRSSVKTVGVKKLVDYLWQEFCELPDRSSPEDYPDMALVSLPELTAIVETYLERSAIEAPSEGEAVAYRARLPDEVDDNGQATPGAWHYGEAPLKHSQPLYTRPSPAAHSEVTEAALKAINKLPRHVMETSDNNGDVFVSLRRVRAALTVALKGDRP